MLKIAALAPTPTTIVRIVSRRKPGDRRVAWRSADPAAACVIDTWGFNRRNARRVSREIARRDGDGAEDADHRRERYGSVPVVSYRLVSVAQGERKGNADRQPRREAEALDDHAGTALGAGASRSGLRWLTRRHRRDPAASASRPAGRRQQRRANFAGQRAATTDPCPRRRPADPCHRADFAFEGANTAGSGGPQRRVIAL
jgi:hypothetical protein